MTDRAAILGARHLVALAGGHVASVAADDWCGEHAQAEMR